MSPAPGTTINEHTVQKDFVDLLRGDGAYVRVVTGSLLNPGMPDTYICTRNGRHLWVENKMWRRRTAPTEVIELTNLLDGPQRNFILGEVWRRGAPCFICAFTFTGEAWVTEGRGVYRNTLEYWANYFANL